MPAISVGSNGSIPNANGRYEPRVETRDFRPLNYEPSGNAAPPRTSPSSKEAPVARQRQSNILRNEESLFHRPCVTRGEPAVPDEGRINHRVPAAHVQDAATRATLTS